MTDRPHLETLERIASQVPPGVRGKKLPPHKTISTVSSILHKIGPLLSEDEKTLLHGVQAQAYLDAGVGGDKERAMVEEADEVRRRAEAAQTPASIRRKLR